MFDKLKDAGISKGAQMAINNQIKEYGKVLRLNLDSKAKSIELEVELKGEKAPLSVSVERYNIIEDSGRHFVEINGVNTSREWINIVASSYLEGKHFEIPAEYAKMIKVIA